MCRCPELVQFVSFSHATSRGCFNVTFVFYVTETRFEFHGLGTNSLLVEMMRVAEGPSVARSLYKPES